MIARPLPAPRVERLQHSGWRTARAASSARRARTRRMRYELIVRTVSGLGVATVVVLVYLALLANITRLNYEVSHAKQARARIGLQAMRADDEIARLASRDKLAAIAARLGMREPTTFAVVSLPPRHRHATQPPHGVALLSGVAGWLK
jgi:hypothetical protein